MPDLVDPDPHSEGFDRPGHRRIAALATRQGGVVSHEQLLDLGVGRRAIEYRLATGRLHRLYRGVYAVGHRAIAPRGRLTAAILACGRNALLSHRSGGAHWGMLQTSPSVVDVTVPGRARAGQRGIRLHSVRRLDARDRILHEGIPVTTVARTLLDLAEVLPPPELKRAAEAAERMGLFNGRAIDELCGRSPGRRGLRPLRSLLNEGSIEPATRSELESRFLDLCRSSELPRPRVNVWIAGLEVDFLWPEQRLVVELDGYAYHRTRAAFERDRERDATLKVAGYEVLRITHRRLSDKPGVVADQLRRLLEQ